MCCTRRVGPECTANVQVLHLTFLGSRLSLSPFVQAAKRTRDTVLLRWGLLFEVDDDIIMSLARAMPKLEILQPGRASCGTATGATADGPVSLASRCPNLSRLRIHFQGSSLVDAATSTTATPAVLDDEPVVRWKECALTDLSVGETPIPAESAMMVTLVLLQNFPRILNVGCTHREWKTVAETIKRFRRIGVLIHYSGKTDPSHNHLSIMTLP